MKIYERFGLTIDEIYKIYLKYKNYSDTCKELKDRFGIYITEQTLMKWLKKKKTFRRVTNKKELYKKGMKPENIKEIKLELKKSKKGYLYKEFRIILNDGGSFLRNSAYHYARKRNKKTMREYYRFSKFRKRFELYKSKRSKG